MAPDGHGTTPALALSRPGERTKDATLAADSAVSAPPAFAMSPGGRAMIAYATQSNRIRLVTRRAG
ncbi:MAG TPA: hypothetical protein VFY32_07075 [Solirubrobacteraceae bacterium]|nr:hypothetical protein [Solirubrobacteraceae bacterium]